MWDARTWNKGTWSTGTITAAVNSHKELVSVDYQVKHYGIGSEFGIGGGRISKLGMRINGRVVAHYDRGWDLCPDKNDEIVMAAYREILKKYN